MLATVPNEYNWSTTCIGTTYTDTGMGQQVTAGGTAHTKGSVNVAVWTGTTHALAEDVYWIAIWFTNGATSGASAFEAKMFSGF